jgi:hypothetical protein
MSKRARTTAITTINPELKWFDNGINNHLVDYGTDPTLWRIGSTSGSPMFCPQEGSGSSQRVGRQVRVKSITVRANISADSGSAPVGVRQAHGVHIYLVHLKATNGAWPLGTEIFSFHHANSGGSYQRNMNPLRNMQYTHKIRVLHHSKYEIKHYHRANGADTWVNAPQNHWIEIDINNLDIPVNFSGNTGTVTDLEDNSFALFAFTNTQEPEAKIDYQSRVRYTDA